MAEQKKMTVAEILAAARKSDAGKDSGAPVEPAASEAPQEISAVETPKTAATKPAAPKPATAKPATAKPTGGARPSVAEMMAAARAEKKPGAASPAKPAAAAVKPAAAAPVKKEAPPKPAAADKASPKPAVASPVASGPKDTGSILAEARGGNKPGPMSKAEAALKAPVAKPAPKSEKPKIPVPPMPAKPAYAKAQPKPAMAEDRRGFLSVMMGSFLGIGFTSNAIVYGLWTLGTARFMFPNILTEPPSKFKVGFPSNFAPGQVETKFIPQFGVWVVNWEYNGLNQIFALRSVCTHLGCTPNWLEGEQKFKCPCHGSGFYKDGINFEGPAPRPLERYAIHLADDGQLEIDKSKLFQEEIGQWSDPASFVAV
ncbi:MAG TPA: Rieske 2Fe-2S domain-containing protein [Pirellulales bacterium]|nr:Rieske 2Fe-2S domain-containing protein [Pirellulales bacterium]